MKKLLSLLAATGLIAGSLLATALPAQAEEGDTNVTPAGPIAVKDLVVSSKKCKPIVFSLPINTEPVGAEFDLVAARAYISDRVNFWEDYLYTGGTERVLNNTEVEDPWEWCPKKSPKSNVSGLGKFTVEADVLMWWDLGVLQANPNANTSGDSDLNLVSTFTVKQASKASSAKVSKKGTTRTLSAKFTYFDITKKAKKEWTALPKNTKVELQRRAANGKGAWKKIKTVKVGSKGAVKTTYKTKTTYQYRFVYTGSSTKAPVTSKTLKK